MNKDLKETIHEIQQHVSASCTAAMSSIYQSSGVTGLLQDAKRAHEQMHEIGHSLLKWRDEIDHVNKGLNELLIKECIIPEVDFGFELRSLTDSIDSIEKDREEYKYFTLNLPPVEELRAKYGIIPQFSTEKEARLLELTEECKKQNNELLILRQKIDELNKKDHTETTGKTRKDSLGALITSSQVKKMHTELRFIFVSDLEQWERLFSADIPVFETPIILKSTILSDIAILFHYLRKYRLISSNKFPSILEKHKVFEYQGKIITSKQIKKPKENKNFPDIGGNFTKIAEIVSGL